jgi:hypothetical protein
MKMTFDQKAAEERMAPGVLTSQGFLGTDSRRLADIVEADEEAFRAYGLDFEEVADRLDDLAHEGEKGLGEPLTVAGKWLVKSDEARGKIPCPFQDGIFHKNSVSVERADGGERIVYSDLSVHLLRTHHFCQGLGSPFRLDPAALRRLLK